ncbi:hypothetical protein VTJ83DRAFT_4464 [Remersonia thermophila]|uniref:BHLH domain-containing protein n=1 Tax=Remersonia thermophila TaxID=72144 RepID=A0ABR4DA06_9PEZI
MEEVKASIPEGEKSSSVSPLTPSSDVMDSWASTAPSLGSAGPAYPIPALIDDTLWGYFCAGRSASGLHANTLGSMEPWQTLESTPALEARDVAVPPMTPGSWLHQTTGLVSPPISTVGLLADPMLSHLTGSARLRPSWSSEPAAVTTAAFSAATPIPQDNLDDPIPKAIKTEPRAQSQPRRPNVQLRTAARKKATKASRSSPLSATSTQKNSCSSSPSPTSQPSSTSPSTRDGGGGGDDDDDDNDDGRRLDNDGLTPEARRARHNHNRVEKHYRRRLNVQFARLLDVLMLPVPPARAPSIESATTVKRGRAGGGNGLGGVDAGGARGGDGFDEKRISKAEVLELAARRIRELEKDKEALVRERKELVRNLEVLMMAGTVGRGGVVTCFGGKQR